MVVNLENSPGNDTRRRVTVDCVRTDSSTWTRDRLQRLIERPLRNPALEKIEERRRALATLPPLTLHPSYVGKNAYAGQPFVSPKTISLPRRYGRILYSIAAEIRPRWTLEAGAGLGLSGMYLGAASALLRAGCLVSFEISDYCRIAEESIRITFPQAQVHQDDFDNFHRYLDPMTEVDLCFLDSKHDKDTILRNYKSVLGWMSPRGALLIDDVMSTPGSRAAWEHILQRGDFAFVACIQNRIGFLAR
jgi:predicted O-methyltransferase YrrM